MSKKNIWKKVTVLCMSAAFAISAASCDNLISTVSDEDMEQVVATVNVSKHDGFKEGGEFAAYKGVIENLNKNILKRDLIAYFLNVGYTYVNSYGYTYKQTFTTLMDTLVSRKIMVQYAITYYLDAYEGDAVAKYNEYIENYYATKGITDKKVIALYDAHPEIKTLEYFLTDYGTAATEDYDRAVYTLKKMINSTLDSTEANYVVEEDEKESEIFGDSRTTPTGVGTEGEDFYDNDYEIYTGFNAAGDCAPYEQIDGSTPTSRRKAYNVFLANLSDNNLLLKGEETTNIEAIDYYYVELASQLEQALINKFGETLADKANDELTPELAEKKYKALLESQKNSYDKSHSAFETAIGKVSDTSFVLYSPTDGFGFVYNILLPFSASQQQVLSTYTNDTGLKKHEYYEARQALLEKVEGKDLRAAWFSNNEDSNYAYKGAANTYYGTASDYLFFEDNLTKSAGDNAQYKKLKQYAGTYAYNGTVMMDGEDYKAFKPKALKIGAFMDEMVAYLNWNNSGLQAQYASNTDYMNGFYTDGEFDYEKFIRFEGSVTLDATDTHSSYFVEGTKAYTAVSRINELMFAYSTDTGCLNTYMGYTVSAYKTSYVAEFEAAAQYAINKGAGTFVVCPSDYGWHIIYVSFAYENNATNKGEVYAFNKDECDDEGTFSYLFYEAMKAESETSYTNKVQSGILEEYNKKTCVKQYKNRYEDLLSLDA